MMSHNSSVPESPRPIATFKSSAVADGALMREILVEAGQNRALPFAIVDTVLESDEGFVSPTNALDVGANFSMKLSLLKEALSIVERRISHSKCDVALEGITNGLANAIVALTTGISEVRDPLNVLRALHTLPELGVAPEFISAILGIRDERIGGDIERYSRHQVATEYAQGGFMYQPSEIVDIWRLFTHLAFKSGSVFYDLGSGYGHSIFYGAALRPDISFKGIEIMSVRVKECQSAVSRLGTRNLTFEAGDVSKGGFSDADIIFLFNPFPPDTLREVGRHIAEVAEVKPLILLDYRGLVTQTISSVCQIPLMKIAPYRLAASRRFLQESRALVGIPSSGSSQHKVR